MTKRVLLAGLIHETHTFVPGITTLDGFRTLHGDTILAAQGDVSTLAGLLVVARERQWQIIPAIHMDGGAGPLVADAVVEAWWNVIVAVVQQEAKHGIDGICLDMHGAMVSQSLPDVEGELLQRLRTLPGCGTIPIGGVLDPHGNFTQTMALHSNGLIAYRENPHSDANTAAQDGARLLDQLMHMQRPAITIWEHPALLLPPTATGTADEPLRTLTAKARLIERESPAILAVNVFSGFAYADMPEAGISFSAITIGDPAEARMALRQLSDLVLAMKQYAEPSGITLDQALLRLNEHHSGPVLLVEPADNIGGGAPGDLTIVLRGLLEHGVQNAGVIINDPVAVQILAQAQIGDQRQISIGGASGALGAEPLLLQVQLLSISDGSFTLEDRQSHLATAGMHVDMGPCAVVQSAGVTILLTSIPTPPFDLAQWRSQGIDPQNFFVIGVKAAVAHRQAYNPIATASYTLNTIGPCAADLRLLPFQRVARPVYPLDVLMQEPDNARDSLVLQSPANQ